MLFVTHNTVLFLFVVFVTAFCDKMEDFGNFKLKSDGVAPNIFCHLRVYIITYICMHY